MSKYDNHGTIYHASADAERATAEHCRQRIFAYWADRGHSVNVWLFPLVDDAVRKRQLVWSIRSDMVNGRPA